jgi:TolB-like protein
MVFADFVGKSGGFRRGGRPELDMRYRFDQFELDTEQFSLSKNGAPVRVEPLVFDLLRYLVEHAGQVATRDAIIDAVWKGRVVSDATVASCLKAARKALDDSGDQQSFIRTLRGRGVQFASLVAVADAPVESRPLLASEVPIDTSARTDSPSQPPRIAVLPLHPLHADPQLRLLGDAMAQELILELSRLRSLFVIARGSSFQFRGDAVDLEGARAKLGADYFVTGTIVREARRCAIAIELCHVPDNRLIWAERFTVAPGDLVHMRARIAGEVVGALEARIAHAEALQASSVPTANLDAWAAYHRGLWHMFRFNRQDNALAAELFAQAVKRDPKFARAHAGLSFTHFQNAFLGFVPDLEEEKRRARSLAERGVELDPLDPFANLNMGRAEWLLGKLDASLPWIDRAIALRPNYALALYNTALVGTILGEAGSNDTRLDTAIALSPIDPLNYAMLATRALGLFARGELDEAAAWALRATSAPNAHVHIDAIGAFTNAASGNQRQAEACAARVRERQPAYGSGDFLASFPFHDGETRAAIARALHRLGFP